MLVVQVCDPVRVGNGERNRGPKGNGKDIVASRSPTGSVNTLKCNGVAEEPDPERDELDAL